MKNRFLRFLCEVALVSLCSAGAVIGASNTIRGQNFVLGTINSSPVGATTPSTGAFTSLSDSALGTGCVSASSGTLASPQGTCGAIQAITTKHLASPVSITGGVLTTVDSTSITFPSSGGPFRVCGSYGYAWTTSNTNDPVVFYMTDSGGNFFGMSQQGASSGFSSGNSGSGCSSVQYANSATTTIQVAANPNNAITVTTNSGLSSIPSEMQVWVVAGN